MNALHDDDLASGLRPDLRVEGVIARGSSGVVFRGRQLAVDRDVAIKVLHAGFSPETGPGQLFRDEVRAIGTIDHRNVVRVFDAADTLDGRLYFVMELLDGPTLQELAERGPLPVLRAVALVAQLLDGLAAVHAAGHIHADVKPSNAVVVGPGDQERVVLIDFGLSRLRRGDRPAEAVGGTRAYMAPEQLHAWQVDARSDVFSSALILLRLVTGWQRTHDGPSVPPLAGITDPSLRVALTRALALDPSARPSARDFARALRGGQSEEPVQAGPPPPFRDLAPMTERDRGRLYGRGADVLRLARRLESRKAVVFTAPSGTGKTSLLRAGLVPYLDAAGAANLYVACEPGVVTSLVGSLCEGADSIAAALQHWHATRARRLVIILDQLETVLVGSSEGDVVLDALLDPDARPAGIDIAVVLGIREDFVARLLATPVLSEGVPQVRLGPLDRDGARDALVQPLVEHGMAIDPDLLELLLDDLAVASGELGADLGWPGTSMVFPPHLQLAGSTLFDALGPGETTLTLAHYRRLGGFAAIAGEHLDRCLGELSADDRVVARELFLTLVASAQIRAIRSEADLLDTVGARHGEPQVSRVLHRLQRHRLVNRRIVADGTPSWSLVHDTLVPRIEAWLSVLDLDRRRASEILRFHLRQSQPDAPAALSAGQLRILSRFPGLVEDLEIEWERRAGAVWTPRLLIERSRQIVRYRRGIVGSVVSALTALTLLLLVRWLDERALRQREAWLSDLNLGRFDLQLAPFDWRMDDATHAVMPVPVQVSQLPDLDWDLYEPATEDPDSPGQRIQPPRLARGIRQRGHDGSAIETGIEVRGGNAFLMVTRRGRAGESCSPAVIPVRRLPGHGERGEARRIHIDVPTCRATRFDTVHVASGPFIWGGLGVPPARFAPDKVPPEKERFVPGFSIDRTEITHAAFAVFARMSSIHDIWVSEEPEALRQARRPDYPQADIDWFDARAYCRFVGKELPSSMQWQKALRGGLALASGPNRYPRRNQPWGSPAAASVVGEPAAIAHEANDRGKADDVRRPSPVASFPFDVSPYGVYDLAGNLQEWTTDVDAGTGPWLRRPRLTRGGNWYDTSLDALNDYMAIQNPRSPRARFPYLGARCVTNE